MGPWKASLGRVPTKAYVEGSLDLRRDTPPVDTSTPLHSSNGCRSLNDMWPSSKGTSRGKHIVQFLYLNSRYTHRPCGGVCCSISVVVWCGISEKTIGLQSQRVSCIYQVRLLSQPMVDNIQMKSDEQNEQNGAWMDETDEKAVRLLCFYCVAPDGRRTRYPEGEGDSQLCHP